MVARKKNKGLCWCVHHNQLLEYCYDFARRVEIIKIDKPVKERPIRLYEMRFVKGKLPAEIVKANAKMRRTDNEGTHNEREDARDEWYGVFRKYLLELEKLHKKEVRKTCWDGSELNFRKSKIK